MNRYYVKRCDECRAPVYYLRQNDDGLPAHVRPPFEHEPERGLGPISIEVKRRWAFLFCSKPCMLAGLAKVPVNELVGGYPLDTHGGEEITETSVRKK